MFPEDKMTRLTFSTQWPMTGAVKGSPLRLLLLFNVIFDDEKQINFSPFLTSAFTL